MSNQDESICSDVTPVINNKTNLHYYNESYDSLDSCIDYRVTRDAYLLQKQLKRQSLSSTNKKHKKQHLVPISFCRLHSPTGTDSFVDAKGLLDSGGSGCLIAKHLTQNLPVITPASAAQFLTAAGTYTSQGLVHLKFSMPELHHDRLIEWQFHVAENLGAYDLIIGRDLMQELPINLHFDSLEIEWDNARIPMRPIDATSQTSYHIQDPPAVADATERIKAILDAKYEKANISKLVNEQTHLSTAHQDKLHELLSEFEDLFDGTLGKWRGRDYTIELKEDATPYHARPYPIPKAYEQTLRMEVDRLCELGVLKKTNRSEWAAPTFIIPKKDGTVRFINDFRELNKRIKRKPFPIPNIQDLLLKLEGFKYATSLDLNMGYYHIRLSPDSRKLCTIVLPWGKYEMQRLPMGLCNSPDIFQEKMSELFYDLEFVRCYIDDLLIITKGSLEHHLTKLRTVFKRLRAAGLKVNATKSFFARPELEYLGYWISRNGISPVPKKIKAIQALQAPTNKKELRRFLGLINYYRDMWARRSETLAPLTALSSKTTPWVWTDEHQKAFDKMKSIIGKTTLLTYPDFTKPFDIHTDASHLQIGAVISQNNRPIAFYTRKLNPAQTRYTTTERELLAIVETLKEFRNILLGHTIRVFTDHKNLTYQNFTTERVMRWRLIIEEFGPELIYLQGKRNIVADALSRIESIDTIDPDNQQFESLVTNEVHQETFPLTYKNISIQQNSDESLLQKIRDKAPHYKINIYRGGGKARELITFKNKIVIPQSLQRRCVEWYHVNLCHPGETRTEHTIRQHFHWTNLRKDIETICRTCPTCQLTKKKTIKYGHLPAKEAEIEPWEVLCVDTIGPYKIKIANSKDNYELQCLTMIDPATGWFEMVRLPDKTAISVAQKAELTWFTRYPWPQKIIYDRGTEFLKEFLTMVRDDYGISLSPITVRNPQANSIIERIHQTIGNILRTFELQNSAETEEIDGILAATMFAVRATYHTTLKATPSQLIFGRDAILNTKFEANWQMIRQQKQKRINKNNIAENAKRKPYTYSLGQRVMILQDSSRKFGTNAYKGPYEITTINPNGTVRLRIGAVQQTYNIRNIHPYYE